MGLESVALIKDFMTVFYNPTNRACKSITGAIPQGKSLQFNIFLLKDEHKTADKLFFTPTQEQCLKPTCDAYLLLNKDGESLERHQMQVTEFGWSISLKINQIGLYFYTF